MTINPILPPAPPPQESRRRDGKSTPRARTIAGAAAILAVGGIVGFAAAPTPEPVTHTKFITEPAPPLHESCQNVFKEAEESILEMQKYNVIAGDVYDASREKDIGELLIQMDKVDPQKRLIETAVVEYFDAKDLCEEETGVELPVVMVHPTKD